MSRILRDRNLAGTPKNTEIFVTSISPSLSLPSPLYNRSVEYVRGKDFQRWMTSHVSVMEEYLPGLPKPASEKVRFPATVVARISLPFLNEPVLNPVGIIHSPLLV